MKITIDDLREMIRDLKKERYDVLLATPSQGGDNKDSDKVLNEKEDYGQRFDNCQRGPCVFWQTKR